MHKIQSALKKIIHNLKLSLKRYNITTPGSH